MPIALFFEVEPFAGVLLEWHLNVFIIWCAQSQETHPSACFLSAARFGSGLHMFVANLCVWRADGCNLEGGWTALLLITAPAGRLETRSSIFYTSMMDWNLLLSVVWVSHAGKHTLLAT